MNGTNQNTAVLEIGESQPELQKSNCHDLARRALRLIASPKEWSGRLGISSQQVYEWKNGGAIPERRQVQIVHIAKIFLLDLDDVEREIDRMLLRQYGSTDSM